MSWNERRAISRSHDRSMDENVTISYLSDSQWSVPSFSDPDEVYMVERNDESGRCHSCEKAGLYCAPCNICAHSYSCTCPDYLIHDNICTHIHRVAMVTTNTVLCHRRKMARRWGRLNRSLPSLYHQEGVENNIEITNIFNNLWLIPSFTDVNKVYAVERNNENCRCDVRCESCNICVHTFSCTCPIFGTTSNICKHIHKVAWETVDEKSSESDSDKSTGSWAEFAWTKLTPVQLRHEKSVQARVEVSKISESKWLVPSFTNADIVYTVEKNVIVSCFQCKSKDRCQYCNICVHSYTCTCPDHDDNFSICKHIHKVASLKNIEVLTNDDEMNSV